MPVRQQDPQEPKPGGCSSCGGKGRKKSFGALEMAQAILSGKAGEDIAKGRMEICEACTALDENTGERLYRLIDEVAYCGKPRLGWAVYRDDRAKGCGCKLADKVKYKGSSCPLGNWTATPEEEK